MCELFFYSYKLKKKHYRMLKDSIKPFQLKLEQININN